MTARLLFILYCLEASLFLLIVPWTSFWVESVATSLPAITPVLQSMFVRGVVSGLGLIHILVAIREVITLMSAGRVKLEE